jgi:hypothetical protein
MEMNGMDAARHAMLRQACLHTHVLIATLCESYVTTRTRYVLHRGYGAILYGVHHICFINPEVSFVTTGKGEHDALRESN